MRIINFVILAFWMIIKLSIVFGTLFYLVENFPDTHTGEFFISVKDSFDSYRISLITESNELFTNIWCVFINIAFGIFAICCVIVPVITVLAIIVIGLQPIKFFKYVKSEGIKKCIEQTHKM